MNKFDLLFLLDISSKEKNISYDNVKPDYLNFHLHSTNKSDILKVVNSNKPNAVGSDLISRSNQKHYIEITRVYGLLDLTKIFDAYDYTLLFNNLKSIG